MQLQWLGHSCFKITGKDVTIICDPFDDSIGFKMTKIQADIVTITHDHFDHNNIDAIKGDPFIISKPGEYEVKGVFVYGISSWHDNMEGEERGANTIYLIKTEGINIVHLGDLGHKLKQEQLNILQKVDILLIPVGGTYTLDAKLAREVVSQLEPRIIIPMHYNIPGLKIEIDDATKFFNEMGVQKPEVLDKLKITSKDLPVDDTQLIILEKA